ncbi:MAG: hypothetical protein EPN98_02575 [Phenylobacterium sp.]|uniref:hypothetical protein n=1 Tax=Phenylobacterium sp. TaxID=1871053 RepID=UPI001209448F|nr:hypothetical protein [Phenylobacterium sp.]TAL37653.1 MAG: hypothetical protein EPN98_02575 [Phenylobacterium sp.]
MSGRKPVLIEWRWVGFALAVLLAFDVTDIAFYAGHVLSLHGLAPGWLQTKLFDINREFGLVEDLEYGKSLVCAVAMGLCARRRREIVFVALAALHIWLAADNAMALHERIGRVLGERLLGGATLGLERPADLAQVVFFGTIGLMLIALFAVLLRRAPPPLARTGVILLAAAASPGLFGVFVDAFRATPAAVPLSETALIILEDGGETVMLSLATALCIGCLRHSRTWGRSRVAEPAGVRA